MPKYERYPNEAPEAARRRIARNRAPVRGQGLRGQAPRAPRPQAPVAPDATRGDLMLRGYEGQGPQAPQAPQGREPMTRGKGRRRRPGYNFTKNIGGTPDVGY
tara:strand:+ start:319 stop:627 length:309 start_codon:yes stop_codon:yes gene_type:complete